MYLFISFMRFRGLNLNNGIISKMNRIGLNGLIAGQNRA